MILQKTGKRIKFRPDYINAILVGLTLVELKIQHLNVVYCLNNWVDKNWGFANVLLNIVFNVSYRNRAVISN